MTQLLIGDHQMMTR